MPHSAPFFSRAPKLKQGQVSRKFPPPKRVRFPAKSAKSPKEVAGKNADFPPEAPSFLFENGPGFPKKLPETARNSGPQCKSAADQPTCDHHQSSGVSAEWASRLLKPHSRIRPSCARAVGSCASRQGRRLSAAQRRTTSSPNSAGDSGRRARRCSKPSHQSAACSHDQPAWSSRQRSAAWTVHGSTAAARPRGFVQRREGVRAGPRCPVHRQMPAPTTYPRR